MRESLRAYQSGEDQEPSDVAFRGGIFECTSGHQFLGSPMKGQCRLIGLSGHRRQLDVMTAMVSSAVADVVSILSGVLPRWPDAGIDPLQCGLAS